MWNELFNIFIKGLTDLAPTYIIQGNHDYRQDQIDSPDLLSSILFDNNNKNLAYLYDSGCYTSGDCGFGIMSVRETLKEGDTFGQNENLPPFPNNFPTHIKTKIALFHGTIINSKLQNYTESISGYPKDWFKGYDICLLGDIHLQQVSNVEKTKGDRYKWMENKQPWGYPGSLIQQNFGEPLFGHGYLLWDLEKKEVSEHHVYNNYGLLYINKQSGKWIGECGGNGNEKYTNIYKRNMILNELLENEKTPKNLIVKIKGESNDDDINELNKIINDSKINMKIKGSILNTIDIDNNETCVINETEKIHQFDNNNISDYNSLDTWIQYIKEKINNERMEDIKWENWFVSPETINISIEKTASILNDKVKERNIKINKAITKLGEQMNKQHKQLNKSFIKLKMLKWSWLLCYKDNNWFDFGKMSGKVCTINARNDSGKSSFLEILCFSLFGQPIPSRYNKEHSSSIICWQKPIGKKSETTIEFEINGKLHKLYKTYEKKSDDQNRLQITVLQLFEINSLNNDNKLIKSGVTAVKEWIEENIGTIESFLLSCLLTQNSDNDLFSLKREDQIGLLDKALHLESFESLCDMFKEASLGYKNILENTETLYNNENRNEIMFDKIEFDRKQIEYEVMKNEMEKTENEMSFIKETWHLIDINDIELNENEIEIKIKDGLELSNNLIVHEKINDLIEKKGELNSEFRKIHEALQEHYEINECDLIENQKKIEEIKKQKIEEPTYTKHNLDQEFKIICEWKDKSKNKDEYGVNLLKLEIMRNEMENQKIKKEKLKMENKYKPNSTKEKLYNENIEIKEWENKLMGMKNINYEEEVKKMNEILYLIESQKNKMMDIYKKKPNKSARGIYEYNIWKEKYEKMMHVINDKYETIEKLQKYCLENLLIEPKIDKITIDNLKCRKDKMDEQIRNEKRKVIKWCDMDDEIFRNEYQIMTQNYNKLVEENKIQIKEMKKMEDEVKNKQNKWQEKMKECDVIKKESVKEPKSELKEIEKWEMEYDSMKLLKKEYENRKNISQKIIEDVIKTKMKVDNKQKIVDEIKEKIKFIENNEHPYNPDCWACQKQPWKLQKNEMEKQYLYENNELDILKNDCNELLRTYEIDVIVKEEKECSEWLKNYIEKYEKCVEYWNNEKNEWNKYLIYINHLNDNEKLLKQYYEQWNEINIKLEEMKIKITYYEKDIIKKKEIFDDITYCDENISRWNDMKKEMNEITKIINEDIEIRKKYEKNVKYHEDLCGINIIKREEEIWNNEIKIIEEYEKWENDKNVNEREINKNSSGYESLVLKVKEYEKYLNEKENWENRKIKNLENLKMLEEWEDWIKRIEKCEKEIEEQLIKIDLLTREVKEYEKYLIEKKEMEKRKEKYEREMSLLTEWTDWIRKLKNLEANVNRQTLKIVEEKIKNIEKYETLMKQINYWKDILKIRPQYIKKNEMKKIISVKKIKLHSLERDIELLRLHEMKYMNHVNIKHELAQSIEHLRKSKDAINHIIELFGGYKSWLYKKFVMPRLLNKVNKIVESVTETNLYKLEADIGSNNGLSWFISDGVNRTIIEKSGGFRKFIFGLAVRITLSYLGASNVMCKQLFIDEGFVSADSENLEKIPEFIKSLIGIYDSVLLVSHLDIIKDSGEINVFIKRSENRLSQIQFGDIQFTLNSSFNNLQHNEISTHSQKKENIDENKNQIKTCNQIIKTGKNVN